MSYDVDLTRSFAAAGPGAVLACSLVPLNDIGPLRITYNWLDSALNCDPGDQSPFRWVIARCEDGGHVSLSPQEPFQGMTLYASVRPDLDYTVQVQAPNSADWITAIGGDEMLALTHQGFLTIALQGVNGSYVCADTSQTGHDDSNGNYHSGHLFRSSAGSIGLASSFFVVVDRAFQDVGIPRALSLGPDPIAAALAAQGVADVPGLTQRILSLRS